MPAEIHLMPSQQRNNDGVQPIFDNAHDALHELDQIIENEQIVSHFQPIFDLSNNQPFAYEALSRGPQESPLHMPDALFTLASQHNRVMELDRVCRKKAIESFKNLSLPGKLSVNVSPNALIHPNFKGGRTIRLLQECGIPMEQVILELTEQQSVDHEKLKAAALYYQSMGFSIALDDLGAGYSSLRLLAELRPDYIKLDKFFIADIHENEVAGDFVRLIVDLAARVNCKVVAEGIETKQELNFVRESSISFGQGFLLGRPAPDPEKTLADTLCLAVKDKQSKAQVFTSVSEKESIVSLNIHPTETCGIEDLASGMLARFQNHPRLLAIPVLNDERVVGVLLRDEILKLFSTPYAHSLYLHATAESMMIRAPLVVQLTDSLAYASQQATNRAFNQAYCPLIVCDGETYVGTLSIRELLKNITKRQVEHALHCNPLSGLPGNIRIESEVQTRLIAQNKFVLLHFDLDNFKAYNDFYGYERGDKMLCLVAHMLQETTRETDFVGHIGGDDFVMLIDCEDWEERIWNMLNVFSERSAQLYDPTERQQKYIKTTDRAGEIKCFGLASLSVSALQCDPGQFQSHLQTAEVIAEIKHKSKMIEGNSLVIDRRVA